MSGNLDGYLETIQPELVSTARLFGFSEECWGDPPRFRFTAEERPGEYAVTFTDGETSETGRCPVPDDPDPRVRELHRKRAARRL